ncbi:MAG: B12-binding domain-containing radical SAM protein [Deltaproteobacteria bacterium RIFOXYD12_FULL_57_12]|nr:MAG: B12-binding domain-containing radical SAM protein [Deltaproteobacteria bacterium RIFOXYD12_FULL_57_12]
MRILLISPNTLIVPYPVYPIGLDYVAGCVSADHQVKIADMNILSLAALEEILQDFFPEIIGLSCRNIDNTDAGDPLFFISEYRELVVWLRERSRAVLVCGGSGFTIMPERVFAALGVDYGIIGEGERFGLLVDGMQKGLEPTQIPGVISAFSSPETPEPWTGKQMRAFQRHASHIGFYLKKGGMLNLQTKRGCSFNCIYCPYPNIEGKRHRLAHPDEVARTAMDLQEAGAKYLFITDSAFNSDLAHSLAVANAFKAAGLSIPWGGFFAPLRLPPDYFTIMAAAGLKHVEFGTESMSAAMLATYRKPFGIDEVFTAHKQAQEAGLHVAHYFLMGGPGESPATVTESLDHIERLNRTVLFFFVGIRIYPGTALYDIALDEGKITPETDMLEPVFYEAKRIDRDAIKALVTARANKRINWILGSGDARSAATVRKMYDRGYSGPLWEFLAG